MIVAIAIGTKTTSHVLTVPSLQMQATLYFLHEPITVKEVRRFIGGTGFFANTVADYSLLCAPLHRDLVRLTRLVTAPPAARSWPGRDRCGAELSFGWPPVTMACVQR